MAHPTRTLISIFFNVGRGSSTTLPLSHSPHQSRRHSPPLIPCAAVAAAGVLGAFMGARVIVFGSIKPWYESVAIALGAEYVATVEYAPLSYDYDRDGVRIETFMPNDASLEEARGTFDVAMSISSFEHDGLGRLVQACGVECSAAVRASSLVPIAT